MKKGDRISQVRFISSKLSQDNKGLSTIIATLLMIVLALVSVGIIWVVIQNIITTGTEEVSLGKFTLNLEVKEVKVENDGVHVTVKRNVGKGDLNGIKFVINDDFNNKGETLEEKNIDLKELGEKTFVLNYTGIITRIKVAPLIGTSSGGSSIGQTTGEFQVDEKETMKSFPGLVSWWRFEGNANDEMGRNNGVVNGTTLVNGKFGKGYEFNGDAGNPIYIDIPNSQSIQLENSNMTLMAWIYLVNNEYGWFPILSKGNFFMTMDQGYTLATFTNTNQAFFGTGNNLANAYGSSIPIKEWTHLAGNQLLNIPGNTTSKIYLNGNLDKEEIAISGTIPLNNVTRIGSEKANTFFFNGTIDEVMMFNKTLSETEIQYIYNMDLS